MQLAVAHDPRASVHRYAVRKPLLYTPLFYHAPSTRTRKCHVSCNGPAFGAMGIRAAQYVNVLPAPQCGTDKTHRPTLVASGGWCRYYLLSTHHARAARRSSVHPRVTVQSQHPRDVDVVSVLPSQDATVALPHCERSCAKCLRWWRTSSPPSAGCCAGVIS